MKYNPLLKYAGIAAIPAYVFLTFLSHLSAPKINPMDNWLSDFGSPMLNPSGAIFYNAGCILTSALLILFFAGITQWYRDGAAPRKYTVGCVCAQVSGFFAAACLVFAALIPIGTSGLHSVFSMWNMIGFDCFMSFMAVSIFLNPNISSGIGILGVAASAFNIVTTNAFENLFIAQWIYIPLFMLFVLLIIITYPMAGHAAPKQTVQGAA
jgi:hypothetical protein